jgi:hypothetical protein
MNSDKLLQVARAFAAMILALQAYVATNKTLVKEHDETPAGIIENKLDPRGDM